MPQRPGRNSRRRRGTSIIWRPRRPSPHPTGSAARTGPSIRTSLPRARKNTPISQFHAAQRRCNAGCVRGAPAPAGHSAALHGRHDLPYLPAEAIDATPAVSWSGRSPRPGSRTSASPRPFLSAMTRLRPGRSSECPKCGSQTEVFSRIVATSGRSGPGTTASSRNSRTGRPTRRSSSPAPWIICFSLTQIAISATLSKPI